MKQMTWMIKVVLEKLKTKKRRVLNLRVETHVRASIWTNSRTCRGAILQKDIFSSWCLAWHRERQSSSNDNFGLSGISSEKSSQPWFSKYASEKQYMSKVALVVPDFMILWKKYFKGNRQKRINTQNYILYFHHFTVKESFYQFLTFINFLTEWEKHMQSYRKQTTIGNLNF